MPLVRRLPFGPWEMHLDFITLPKWSGILLFDLKETTFEFGHFRTISGHFLTLPGPGHIVRFGPKMFRKSARLHTLPLSGT